MGNRNCKKNPQNCTLFEEYIKKINNKRKNSTDSPYDFYTKNIPLLKRCMCLDLDRVFEDDKDSKPVTLMKESISKYTSRDICSIISFVIWEFEYTSTIKDTTGNIIYNNDVDSKRISSFIKIENNILLNLIQSFDIGIVATYEDDIMELVKKTCPKFNNTGYKKKTVNSMIRFISEITYSDIVPLDNQADLKICIRILKHILSLVKKLGIFISSLISHFNKDLSLNSSDIEYKNANVIINCLLKFNFNFYIFSMYLSKIYIHKDITYWMGRKSIYNNNTQQVFEDLVYLNKFITNEREQKVLRNLTMRSIEYSDSLNFNYLYTQINQRRMDMTEFLGHVNHHMKLDLDNIFYSNMSDMLLFFYKIEDFMDKIFHNAELEIKIDLIRVILRINDSTDFFHRIFIIHMMNLEYLNSCQIFALFNQVVIHSELKITIKDK